MRRTNIPALVTLLLALGALACNLPLAGVAPAETPTLTEAPREDEPAPATATATPQEDDQTAAPGTRTPVPSPTPRVTATPYPDDCKPGAHFVEDLSIPDGTRMDPGEEFEKVWLVENDGCAPWPQGVRLVYDRGDRMDGPQTRTLTPIEPGEEVEVAVSLTAPQAAGSYRGYWRFETAGGERFGGFVYADIVVGSGGSGQLPDLTVINYTYSVTAAGGGEYNISVTATIKNVGAGAAPASKAAVGIPGGGSERDVPALAAGASYNLTATWRVDGGTYEVTIILDPGNSIPESGEGNNETRFDVPAS